MLVLTVNAVVVFFFIALTSFFRGLLRASDHERASDKPLLHAILLGFSDSDISFVVLFDHDVCEHWLPTIGTASPVLTSPAVALGQESVQLEVSLDFGSAPLTETMGLLVGDILVSRTPIDSAFQVSLPGTAPLATARLYRQGPHRALQLDSATNLRPL